MVRVRVRINGVDNGIVTRVNENMSMQDFMQEAKQLLLDTETAANVDDDQVVMYLDGDRVRKLSELEKDDVIVFAFNGSPYKHSRQM
eukprot:1059478-Prymnesium_polylepis.1